MSTTPIADDPNPEMTRSPAFDHTTLASYNYFVTHVFFPLELPPSDYTPENDLSLARAVCAAAHAYSAHVRETSELQWHRTTKMLDNLQASVQSEYPDSGHVTSQLRGMQTGDILVFFVRPQNVAVILTKRTNCTLFESFEVSPSNKAVEQTAGSLMCAYPGSAVETPNEVFDDDDFQSELTNLLSGPNAVNSDLPSPPPTHPEYITPLLAGILRSVGRTVAVPRITKCVRDNVGQWPIEVGQIISDWRRSSLWLLIRVAIQTSVNRSPLGRASYKQFMLFFICTLARDPNNATLSSDLLQLMSCKILRRLSKFRSSTPKWLFEMALKTSSCLGDILDARWQQPSARAPPFRNPSQDELKRDMQLSLVNSREHICNALANHSHELPSTPFHPNDRRRGTIDDFLSSDGTFFEEACRVDRDLTLYDVEQSVEQGLDDWVACVTNVEEACAQLQILMDKYMVEVDWELLGDPEGRSIGFLTAIELFVAVDKLVVKEIPMLADYSPEIPIVFLQGFHLRRTTSLHRLARVYQYLSARQSQSRPGWSILSDEFTEDSFPVRYYDQSPRLQQLKARIERDAMVAGCAGLDREAASLAHVYEEEGYQEHQPQLYGRQLADGEKISPSSLPALPLHAKVVVFELQCPACIRIWRPAAARILEDIYERDFDAHAHGPEKDILLAHVPGFQPYFVEHEGPPLNFQIQFAYFYPNHQNSPVLRYMMPSRRGFSMWRSRYDDDGKLVGIFSSFDNVQDRTLSKYVDSTSHTPNDVLADQADCPADFSLDEFVAFGHLRSGGSLQWLNILRGLRSRTLNFRRRDVHHLLAYAAFQVGPLDLNTGTWTWHKELQDSSFCDVILNELDALFVEVGTGSIDSVMMNTISLLLTRVLASNPSECVSERVVAFLRNVRRKTFSWVQELSYNLAMEPMNQERSELLHDMAATCRSTFDVDSMTLRKVLHSAEDIDALLSCAFFIYAFYPETDYSQVLLRRDRHLAPALEGISRDVILADALDYGVDLAVGKIFASHKPSAHRWEQLDHPNTRWLTCRTEATGDRLSQTVHLNLLDGVLWVDGLPAGGLPHVIMNSPQCRRIFRDQGFFLIASNLPGMDFTTLATTSERKVHFSLRGDSLALRAQCDQTNELLELIPSTKLEKDLPPALVDGHVHWLNLSTKTIEIRPLERLWEESSENWKIDCTSEQYHVYKGCETLVDIRSSTWAVVARCFECPSQDLLISTMSPVDYPQHTPVLRLSVALPRYGLSFFVNEQGELESHDFKDMVYDENPCVGALFGLDNLLALRQKPHFPEELIQRRILIRDGPSYHTYNVDTELGYLIGNGTLTSTRYLAYLHAKTSCHRPDPLTGKTGAHAALCLLHSAECRSIMKLKALDGDKCWTSTKYPQINIAHKEIRHSHFWKRGLDSHEHYLDPHEHFVGGRSVLHNELHTYFCGMPGPLDQPLRASPHNLLSNRSVPELPARSTLHRRSHKTLLDDIPQLDQLTTLLMSKSEPSFQREYITRLNASTGCVREESRVARGVAGENRVEALEKHYVRCREKYLVALRVLKKNLGPTTDPHEQALDRFGQWPPITADALLRCLAPTSQIDVPPRWKKCLVSLALLLLELQRARRLLRFALDDLEEEFSKELENEGCGGWQAEEYPEWLLIQIQGNFLIRRTQAETAMEMMSPKSGRNAVMQVNMGEGKSSVIIPIAAAALADGKQLVRVIVPKALMVQMFELFVSRLGGLTNRPIYHLPFSRSSSADEIVTPRCMDFCIANPSRVNKIHEIMSQCMAERGILLVQPEHAASLKLMSVEAQIHEGKLVTDPLPKPQKLFYKHITTVLSLKSLHNHSLVNNIFRSLTQSPDYSESSKTHAAWASGSASEWLNLQKWIHSHSRDILDGSDEILHPRFQLIYTIGLQQHMDGYPDRWTITQQVLRFMKRHAYSLSTYAPNFIESEHGPPGSFPRVRIVRTADARRRLVSSIVDDVMTGRLSNLKFQHISPALDRAIRSFISDEVLLSDTAKSVEEYAKSSQQSNLWGGLLLLRGLLASNILLFALAERRWRIDYGLVLQPQGTGYFDDPPTMLAVPYRAKDVPAPNTQFGHPDIIIILTCLSYYYTGLSEEQLRVSFEILLDQDDPSAEYALWVKEYDSESTPEAPPELREINLKSSEQWDKLIFPLFSRNQAAIDFYLSQLVFPKEAKEFPWKLSVSSWDLAEKHDKVITGLSGTNDGQWLLPMSMAQLDLDHQQGTNARVLAYLLQSENNSYMVTHENGERCTTVRFLQMVATQQPNIRVLLDVGAQILDFSNNKVAEAWLGISRDAAGAVYFSEDDELMVLTKSGITQSMRSSSLSQQLDRCIVYLDHAHTRGTDIKLPIGSRAAVTLGPKVTKDDLVQGCMRMRKLGHGHSVMFFAPLGVDRSIRAVVGKHDPNTQVATADILCWAIHETWTDIQKRVPYWAQQGMSHKSRSDAWSRFCNNEIGPDQLSDVWFQPDIKSLTDLYTPRETQNVPSTLSKLDPDIRQRCKDLGVLSLPSAQMEEEQEREVSRERERERELELPPRASPAGHHLHPDVVKFVKTGEIPPLVHANSGFHPVFTSLEKSSAATYDADVWSPFILATADFCKTIEPESTHGTMDQYLRPVQWILSRRNMPVKDRDQLLILLSPFEADSLMPDIRESEYVHLHVYAPRTSQRMKPSDDLRLYSIPPLPSDWTPPWALIDQLNVFAGQLYLRDYQSYLRLCRFLEVPTKDSPNDAGVRWNQFRIPGSFEENEIRFPNSPLPSVMALLAMRNRGRPFTRTHMGKILQGQPLTEKDFEGPTSGVSQASRGPITCDRQIPHDATPENMPPSPSNMECDSAQDDPGSSLLLRLCKRGLDSETAGISDADSEPPHKRLRRADQ